MHDLNQSRAAVDWAWPILHKHWKNLYTRIWVSNNHPNNQAAVFQRLIWSKWAVSINQKKKKSQIILQSLDSTTAVQRKFTITLFSMWAKCLHSPDLRSNTWSVSLTWKEKITHSFFSFELFSIIKEASISDFLLYWSSKQFGALVNSVMNSLKGNIPIHKVLPFPVYT